MERESIKNKLDSVDLSKVPNLEWDQERSWNRLNAQLEATPVHRTPWWKYGVAACILFLTTLGTGYFMTQNISKPEVIIASNDIVAIAPLDTIVESHPQSRKPKKESVLKEVIPAISSKKENKHQFRESKKSKAKASVIQNKIATVLPVAIEKEPTGHIDVKSVDSIEAIDEIEINELPKKIENEKITSSTTMTALTSKPVKRNTKKLRLKLFQKKSKQKINHTEKVPTLTLFARK